MQPEAPTPTETSEATAAAPARWPLDRVTAWYDAQPWLVGCNYLPRTAINQIEMWQAETFDPDTIAQELGWAAGVGLNSLRVYLHDLVWAADPVGLLGRMDRFLDICAGHGIRPMFVLFDDCHKGEPRLGEQPPPRPGMHNSGWRRSPGLDLVEAFADDTLHYAERVRLRSYVQGPMRHFADDERVLMWDLYNEPGNTLKDKSVPLLEAAWRWAREVDPSQPMTTGANLHRNAAANAVHAANSDVISFHSYEHDGPLDRWLDTTRGWAEEPGGSRPVLCTEYMARTKGSTFERYLPVFKRENIGAYHWGLVAGKSGTYWPWESPEQTERAEPELWFHDVLRPDGTPYREDEARLIRGLTGGGGREAVPS